MREQDENVNRPNHHSSEEPTDERVTKATEAQEASRTVEGEVSDAVIEEASRRAEEKGVGD